MNKPDIERIIKFCKRARTIKLIGPQLPCLNQFKNKIFVHPTSPDVVIINSTNQEVILSVLRDITYDCDIIITSLPSTIKFSITRFLDKNYSKFQYSRQMMVNKIREESLYIRASFTKPLKSHNDEITIFLVLKSGGDTYNHQYVNATANNIRNFITHKSEIVCITDDARGINSVDRIVKMNNNWPKWWGKLEMFRDDATKNSHCLYLDLDTVCLDNIDYICKLSDGFYGIRDFYNLDTFQTGILKWTKNKDTINIYESAKNQIHRYFERGDHEWIGKTPIEKTHLQDLFPGEICSYKKHLGHIYNEYMSPSIVCFHGVPRPHTVKDKFITDVWKY